MEYGKYIQSDQWKNKRQTFFESKVFTGKCYCCLSEDVPLQLHHKTYKRLERERITDLVALCSFCHKMVHDLVELRGTGKRLTIWTAPRLLRKKMEKGKLPYQLHAKYGSKWTPKYQPIEIPKPVIQRPAREPRSYEHLNNSQIANLTQLAKHWIEQWGKHLEMARRVATINRINRKIANKQQELSVLEAIAERRRK